MPNFYRARRRAEPRVIALFTPVRSDRCQT